MDMEINMLDDEPEEENPLFDFKGQARLITNFIIDDKLKTPFVIAIDGEWGSGKTTFLWMIKRMVKESGKFEELGSNEECESKRQILCRHLKKYLRKFFKKITEKSKKNEKSKILEFRSWEYEKTDVFAALLRKLSDGFEVGSLRHAALKIVADLALRRGLGMTLDEIKNHFEGTHHVTKSLRCDLKKVVKTKTILLIDDLDRCDVDNILRMLESIKWFLTIENMVVVVAVDMNKIENVWDIHYNNKSAKRIGRDHTEKMFQVRFPVPVKTKANLVTYVSRLGIIKGDETQFFVDSMPENPRKLKLGLNLLQLELKNIDTVEFERHIKMNIYRKTLMIWIGISSHHHDIAKIARTVPEILVEAGVICSSVRGRAWLRNYLDNYIRNKEGSYNRDLRLTENSEIVTDSIRPELVEILDICTNSDKSAFDVLRNYGQLLTTDKKFIDKRINLGTVMEELDEFKYILSKIVRYTSL